MSLSQMRAKPWMEEPSNQVPWRRESRNRPTGMVALLSVPKISLNWRLTNSTPSA